MTDMEVEYLLLIHGKRLLFYDDDMSPYLLRFPKYIFFFGRISASDPKKVFRLVR